MQRIQHLRRRPSRHLPHRYYATSTLAGAYSAGNLRRTLEVHSAVAPAKIDRRLFMLELLALTGARSAQTPGVAGPAGVELSPSGPVTSEAPGQVIERLDINPGNSAGIKIVHDRVRVRNCRIRHSDRHGIEASGTTGLLLQNLEIQRLHASARRPPPPGESDNVHLSGCPGVIVTRVKASGGSSNIYAEECAGARLSLLELHDARGPEPRGQNVQFNASPGSSCVAFSAENGPSSWTEDNISVYRSDGCLVRDGLVSYNNSPTGNGVMIEGSMNCLIYQVDAVQQGNGAFGAVPVEAAACGGCWFVRCRTRDSYNWRRDGRAAPTSSGLSFYVRISRGAERHAIAACQYEALANPRNLIWKQDAVRPGWSFTHRRFLARRPIRLAFAW